MSSRLAVCNIIWLEARFCACLERFGVVFISPKFYNQIKMADNGMSDGPDAGGSLDGGVEKKVFDEREFRTAIGVLYVDQGWSSDSLALERRLSERLAGEVSQYGDQAQSVVDVFVGEVSRLTQTLSSIALQGICGDEEAGLKFALGCVRSALGMVGQTLGEYKAMTNGVPAKLKELRERADAFAKIQEIQSSIVGEVAGLLGKGSASVVDVEALKGRLAPLLDEARGLFPVASREGEKVATDSGSVLDREDG